MQVIKRNGSKEDFYHNKIEAAILKAFDASEVFPSDKDRNIITEFVDTLEDKSKEEISVEEIQDKVEKFLCEHWFNVGKAYMLYREQHRMERFIEERIDYMDDYSQNTENAATSSETDPNANATCKDVATLEPEVYKTTNRNVQRRRMKRQLSKDFPHQGVFEQYIYLLRKHFIYVGDEASTPTIKFYCQADDLYPLMVDGIGNLDGGKTEGAPKDMTSFSGQLVNFIHAASGQCKGAVAVPSYLLTLNYYIVKEFGPKWYDKLDVVYTNEHCIEQQTIWDKIRKAFKTFVYGINQKAGNRGGQSPFTNISYFDHTYFDGMFGSFYYPDGTKPEWKAVDKLQRLFMKWFNERRLKSVLTFPVETFCMVHDNKDIIDKEYKDLCAEMYAEGHSFFTYISDSVDSLSSCCFSKDTKVLWKNSYDGVKCTTFEELHDLKWEPFKKNLRVYHNGSWVAAKTIKLPNRKMYKVKTQNNKEFIMSDNHINLTFRGEVHTSELSTDDYLMFNTKPSEAIKENDEHLTYEQGLLVGMFLGDGSFNNYVCEDGSVHTFSLSLNKEKYEKALPYLSKLCKVQLDTPYNNVYPVRINSKELVAFLMKWTGNIPGETFAYNKKLNINCILQSKEFRQGILEGWYLTDGGNTNRCYTVSKELVDSMEILITSLGKQCVIDMSDRTNEPVIVRGEEFNRNYPLYCVRWYSDTNARVRPESGFKWKNNSIYWKITSIEEVNYTDDIYCFEMRNQNEPYFTLPSGLITHNCRLRNKLSKNTFSPTSGMTGLKTGSCNVITLNIARIIQQCHVNLGATKGETIPYEKFNEEAFVKYLKKILGVVYKAHISFKNLLYREEERGMFSVCNGGYIHMKDLYSTIGINGLNEAARYIGLEVGWNKPYVEFLQLVLSTIKKENELHSIEDKKHPVRFNSEQIPAEAVGGKNYRWDASNGYWVPKDENLYNSYFYDAHDNTSILDKFRLHGNATYQYTDGGSALHCNLEDHLSKEQYLKLIDFAIKNGTQYFTFNIPNSECDDCGFITKHPLTKCPKCGSTHITQYSRVIGYLTATKTWGKDRQIEGAARTYSDGKTELKNF